MGFEEFIYGDDRSYSKTWGPESDRLIYSALRKKDSDQWIVGPPGSYWKSSVVFEGTDLRGIWFFLFVPSRQEAFGRYFPLSGEGLEEEVQRKTKGQGYLGSGMASR